MGWPLKKFFGQTAPPVRPFPDGFQLLGPSQALGRFLDNETDRHHVQVYLSDIEPRDFCERVLMQEARIFLACAGNRLDLYAHYETLQRYNRLHSFVELIKSSAAANLITLSGSPIEEDLILGSHGQTYRRMPDRVGCYAESDQAMQAKLADWFEQFQAIPVLPVKPALIV